MTDSSERRRTVITGLGMLTSLGDSVDSTWQRLLAGESGVSLIERWDTSELPAKIGAEIKGTPELPMIEPKTARNIARFARFGIAAAAEAVADAGLADGPADPARAGVIMGTGAGGMHEIVEAAGTFAERGYRRVSPHFMITFPHNMTAYHIAQAFRFLGPNSTVSTACATGAQAIADATATIRRGEADVMLAGGAEHGVFPLFLASFVVQRALSLQNDDPTSASRPFDAERQGFVMGDGAGVLVIEELEHARKRGARIYAELLGAGTSNDGYHPIAPEPEGRGAARAIDLALQDADIQPEAIDYVNAHAASTPLGDSAETKAIKLALGEEHARSIPVSSTKSMIGHTLGAAGAIEAIVCVLSIRDGWVHPTINYEHFDPECDLDYVPNEARKVEVNCALKNSFGLGGQNAALIIGAWQNA